MPKAAMPSFSKSPPELVERFATVMDRYPDAERKKMFGYPAAFVGGNMATGLFAEHWVVRLPDGEIAEAKAAGAGSFEPMPGKPMKAFVVVPAATSPMTPRSPAGSSAALPMRRACPRRSSRLVDGCRIPVTRLWSRTTGEILMLAVDRGGADRVCAARRPIRRSRPDLSGRSAKGHEDFWRRTLPWPRGVQEDDEIAWHVPLDGAAERRARQPVRCRSGGPSRRPRRSAGSEAAEERRDGRGGGI